MTPHENRTVKLGCTRPWRYAQPAAEFARTFADVRIASLAVAK
jgi:hypothetical protein